MKSKPKLIIVLGSGGHTTQMIRLTELLFNSYDFEYVVNDDDNRSINKVNFAGDVHVITRPRRVYDKSLIRAVFLTFQSLIESFKIIKNSNSIAIVSAGPGLTVPLFIWSIFFGKKRIFLESWSRVKTQSTTGRICYFLSNLFFVQWPELLKSYPKAIYVGRLG